jgi:hypothetical protein
MFLSKGVYHGDDDISCAARVSETLFCCARFCRLLSCALLAYVPNQQPHFVSDESVKRLGCDLKRESVWRLSSNLSFEEKLRQSFANLFFLQTLNQHVPSVVLTKSKSRAYVLLFVCACAMLTESTKDPCAQAS